jgi:hypothetical protein
MVGPGRGSGTGSRAGNIGSDPDPTNPNSSESDRIPDPLYPQLFRPHLVYVLDRSRLFHDSSFANDTSIFLIKTSLAFLWRIFGCVSGRSLYCSSLNLLWSVLLLLFPRSGRYLRQFPFPGPASSIWSPLETKKTGFNPTSSVGVKLRQ